MSSTSPRSSLRRLPGGVALVLACAGLHGCSGGGDAVGAEHDQAGESTQPAPRTAASSVPSTVPVTAPGAPPTTAPAPVCVITVQAGDSLSSIAADNGVTVTELESENAIDVTDTIHPGQVFDVCIGNDVDDITGTSRLAPPAAAVTRQQTELNELFADYSLLPLAVDGDSGKYTRQAVCTARMGLGLEIHNGHLPAGSDEEATIFAATELAVPAGAPTDAGKWILVDQTCQVIFTGEGDHLVDVFQTSTGEEGHETHNTRARAFRFDPASENGGWHDSSSFPVEVDNPLNGNMYKPLYFSDGQAIHGAGYIPPEPRSKGCARTFPLHQDMILEWLGLTELTEATWNVREIGVTVVVQGRYQDPTEE